MVAFTEVFVPYNKVFAMVSTKVDRKVRRMLMPGEELLYVGYTETFSMWEALFTFGCMTPFVAFSFLVLWCFILFFVGIVLGTYWLFTGKEESYSTLVFFTSVITGVVFTGLMSWLGWHVYKEGFFRPWAALTSHRLICGHGGDIKQQHQNSASSLEVVGNKTQEGDIHYFGTMEGEVDEWDHQRGEYFRTHGQVKWDYVLRQVPFPHEVIKRAKKVS